MNEIEALINGVLDADSCYPERDRKSRENRKTELVKWYEKYHEVNICYNLYGQDTIDSAPVDEWLDRGVFRKQRHDVNGRYIPFGSKFPYDYTLIMRDKRMFEMFMTSIFGYGYMYCQSFGYLMNSEIYKYVLQKGVVKICSKELVETFKDNKIVFKNTFGFGGEDVIIARVKDEDIIINDLVYKCDEFISSICKKNSIWLIQRYLVQHDVMNCFNSSSINTIRVLTYHTGEEVILGKTVVRFGKVGNDVDNCDRGGCFAGVDINGIVSDSKFNFVDKTRSKCEFYGKQLPFFKDAMNLAITAHSHIPQLFTIGWDIVITPSGPIILEGNDGWDPYLSQAPLGYAQRKTWDKFLSTRNETMKI